MECYKCNNFVHMAKDCRMTVPPRKPQQNNKSHRHEPQKMKWIRKKDHYSNEECTLTLQAKKKKHSWYVDNGCSKHMIGDRDRFLTLRMERKMKVGYGTEEWVTCTLITLSKSTKEKKSEKFPRSRNLPTLCASISNKENKQRTGSNQRNIQQQNHWKLCILI